MTEPGVIVRVLRAQVRASRVPSFNVIVRRQIALLREQPGLVYLKLARRLEPDGSQEAVLFEEWADAASLYAWVGPNLAAPRLVPGARELIDELAVSHFEVVADEGLSPSTSAESEPGLQEGARAGGDGVAPAP